MKFIKMYQGKEDLVQHTCYLKILLLIIIFRAKNTKNNEIYCAKIIEKNSIADLSRTCEN